MTSTSAVALPSRFEALLECLDALEPALRALVVERHYVRPSATWDEIARSLGWLDAQAARAAYVRARVAMLRGWKRRHGASEGPRADKPPGAAPAGEAADPGLR